MNSKRKLRAYQGGFPEDAARQLLDAPAGQPVPAPRAPDRKVTTRIGIGLSVASIIAGLVIAASIGYFYWRSDRVGGELVSQEEHAISPQSGSCSQPKPLSGSLRVEALLTAPSIGLTAPVVQGTGDAQLDVAVGHETNSSWPESPGTTVLAAHDVTWFSELNHLHAGDVITYAEPCKTFRFQVTGGQVVRTGAPIPSTSTPTLALVTCYPLDALFVTPQRYLLNARLVSTTATHEVPAAPKPPPAGPRVRIPVPLLAQNLSLANNNVPLGTLSLTGSPAPGWQQSARPLQVETSALELFFGAIRSAEQRQSGWWSMLAPGVPFVETAPLNSASITGESGNVLPSIGVDGDQVQTATVTAQPTLSGGVAPGRYRVTMSASVRGGDLVVTSWQMQRVG
jgi:sortase A